jgi:O-methyltransferase
MTETAPPIVSEIFKLQEQILLPIFVKLSRLPEQFLLDNGGHAANKFAPGFAEVYERCREYTLTPVKAMYAMYEAACHVTREDIPGDFVECGVWKGGSSMIAALTFARLNAAHRKMYLYDTFAGMPDKDKRDEDSGSGPFQIAMGITTFLRGGHSGIFYASVEEVKKNMESTGYPQELILLVRGLIENTVPGIAPEQIALLHLDSDLYQSTYHELAHLYPRLSRGGVLIIDDYENWKGSREATDQYFREQGISINLNPVGDTGARMGIKT